MMNPCITEEYKEMPPLMTRAKKIYTAYISSERERKIVTLAMVC